MPFRDHTSRNAFTLVELLVVIGIIALLMGILLPALGAARRQAQVTQCLAVQRQIASAAAVHASVHRGYYPLAGDLDIPNTGRPVGGVPGALGDANRMRYSYMYVKDGTIDALTLAPWQAAIARYMGKRTTLDGGNNVEILDQEVGMRAYLKFFLCPSHQHVAGDLPNSLIHAGDNLAWMVQQSYVVNEAAFGFNDDKRRLRGNATRIRRPSATVMMADGLPGKHRDNFIDRGMGWMTFVNESAVAPITLADALAGNDKAGDPESFDRLRHRGKINLVYFDGHAETCRITPGELKNAHLLAN